MWEREGGWGMAKTMMVRGGRGYSAVVVRKGVSATSSDMRRWHKKGGRKRSMLS
jgi:hypothetical protein